MVKKNEGIFGNRFVSIFRCKINVGIFGNRFVFIFPRAGRGGAGHISPSPRMHFFTSTIRPKQSSKTDARMHIVLQSRCKNAHNHLKPMQECIKSSKTDARMPKVVYNRCKNAQSRPKPMQECTKSSITDARMHKVVHGRCKYAGGGRRGEAGGKPTQVGRWGREGGRWEGGGSEATSEASTEKRDERSE